MRSSIPVFVGGLPYLKHSIHSRCNTIKSFTSEQTHLLFFANGQRKENPVLTDTQQTALRSFDWDGTLITLIDRNCNRSPAFPTQKR